MYKGLSLVILFSVLLLGVTLAQNSYAANHSFELEWGVSGKDKPGMFLNPQNLAIDSENNIYVTDLGNSRIQKFDDQGNYIRSWGSQGSDPGQFTNPTGIAATDEYVFVADSSLNTIQKFDSFGNFVMQWGSYGANNSEFRSPNGITISDDEFIYVVDTKNSRIQKFTFDGEYVSSFGQSGKRAGNLVAPIDIAVDNTGNVFVTDPGNYRINVYSNDGNFLRTFDSSVGGFRVSPSGIILDENNNLYTADTTNNRIIQYNEFGFTHSIFGIPGNGDGQFYLPKDVAVDNNGFLYVTDTLNHRIQKLSTPVVLDKLNAGNEQVVIEPETIKPEFTPELKEITEEEAQIPLVNNIPNDFTKPTISVPEDIIIEATGPLTSVFIGNADASDESGILSLTNNAAETFPLGVSTIIWTAIDGSGNMAIASQTVTVQDTTPPEIEQLEGIVFEAVSYTENFVQIETPLTFDAVGIVSVENNAPEVFALGETYVTWTAIDVMGNISTMQQKITLMDSTPPRVDIPDDIIIEANSIDVNTVSLIEPEVFDRVKVILLSNDAPEVFPLGETVVTWTVIDSSGNIGISSHNVTVIDSTPPKILLNDVTLEATVPGGSDILLSTPKINDIQEVNITNDAPDIFPFGETIVTWNVTDQSGNESTRTQIVNVVDTIKPILVVPEDIQIEATGIDTIIDDFGEFTTEDISEIDSLSNDAPESFPLGETIVTWTATDTSGNSVSETQLVSIVDTTTPQIIAPSDIILEAVDPVENYLELSEARVSDAVEIELVENDAPESFPLGETIVTWTATDTSGNSASDTQLIIIKDTVQPTLTGPDNIILEITDELGNIVDIGQAYALDQVDQNVVVTNDAPELFPLGETIVTWTATDTSDNSTVFLQTISIVDTTAPNLVTPQNIIQEANDETFNSVILGNPESSDIVDILTIENDAPESFPLGETIVTWTATDTSGNSVSEIQSVTIIDTTIPSIKVPESVVFNAISEEGNIITLENAIAEDEIGISIITNDAPESFPLGETIVTWTATDTSGNSVSETQLVSVVDTTAPSMLELEDIVENATSFTSNEIELPLPIADDAISDVIIDNNAPDLFPFGETIVTWSAEDQSGNVAYTEQKIIIIDNSPPELQITPTIIIDGTSLENTIQVDVPEIFDIIDSQPIVSNDAPESFPLGETIVTWTATDTSGNSASVTQLISIQICGNSPSYYNLIMGTAADDFLTGTTLPDLIFGEGGDDIIIGENGNDCIFAGEGNDIIFGNTGDDNIRGGQGNDIIKGDSGDDILKGGIGLDMIDGGDDIDTCVIIEEQNNDVVIKCEANE